LAPSIVEARFFQQGDKLRIGTKRVEDLLHLEIVSTRWVISSADSFHGLSLGKRVSAAHLKINFDDFMLDDAVRCELLSRN
jgi:hypothetical protein